MFHPRKRTCPLKINGFCRCIFLLKVRPFKMGTCEFLGGCRFFEAQHTMGFLGSPCSKPSHLTKVNEVNDGLAYLRGQVKPAGCRRDDFLTTNY